jgi:hypothetical protein
MFAGLSAVAEGQGRLINKFEQSHPERRALYRKPRGIAFMRIGFARAVEQRLWRRHAKSVRRTPTELHITK